RPPAATVPDLALFVLPAAEQHALRGIAGNQHDDGLRLAEAGQVMEVAVVAVGVVRVAVARALWRGCKHRHAAAGGLHARDQALAAAAEGGDVGLDAVGDGIHGCNYGTAVVLFALG